jgi:hypothetical protein
MTSPHQASVTTSNASSSSDEFTYVTINRGYQFETILRVLLHEKRYRVEIYSVGEDRKWFLKKKVLIRDLNFTLFVFLRYEYFLFFVCHFNVFFC